MRCLLDTHTCVTEIAQPLDARSEIMAWTGTIRNGVVVLDNGYQLSEGARVEVVLKEAPRRLSNNKSLRWKGFWNSPVPCMTCRPTWPAITTTICMEPRSDEDRLRGLPLFLRFDR